MAEKKLLKPVLIGAVAVVVAISLSVGATLYFLSGSEEGAGTGESLAATAEAEVMAAPARYFNFGKPFITTVSSEGKSSRYLQVYVSAVVHDPAAESAMESHRPLLRSRLLTMLGSGDFLTLQSEEGRQALKGELLNTVNGVLEQEGAPAVDQILFTNFVLQ